MLRRRCRLETDEGVSTATWRVSALRGILPIDRRRIPVEALAGLTLAALAVPEVMGYATIAGMPVVTGLYTLLVPMAAFALLGSSRHLVVGADSATAAVLAAGLAPLAAAGSSHYVALAGLVALMAGVLLGRWPAWSGWAFWRTSCRAPSSSAS